MRFFGEWKKASPRSSFFGMTSIFPVTLNYALHREYLGSGRFSFWARRLPWLRGWTIPSNNTEMNFRFPPIGKTSTLTAKCSAKCLEKVLKYSANVDESHGKKGKHKEFILKKKHHSEIRSYHCCQNNMFGPKSALYFQKNVRKKKRLENRHSPPVPSGPHFQPPRNVASEREVHHSWASSIR